MATMAGVVFDTPRTDEAIRFLEWFSDEHFINFLHSSPIHYQPPRMDIYEDARWKAHPALETFSPRGRVAKALPRRQEHDRSACGSIRKGAGARPAGR